MSSVVVNLVLVQERIQACRTAHNITAEVQLVAVSKLQPAKSILECYEAGHRHFGENYVQELIDKARELPASISWHFIGHLQSNKCKALVSQVPNLSVVETVDSTKLANELNKACEYAQRDHQLRVFVQVNTSGEETKSGCEPADVIPIVSHIVERCPRLEFAGLMTIGLLDGDGTNDFICLARCREDVCQHLGRAPETVQLSMGMSADFELAIVHGSTTVRVGSTIFGARS